MKLFRANLMILIGAILLIAGIAAFVNVNENEQTVQHKIGRQVSNEYREDHSKQKTAALGMLAGGVLLLILGFSTRKSHYRDKDLKAQKEMLNTQMSMNEQINKPKPPPLVKKNKVNKLDELKKLGELRDSGVLTQEEFEAEKAKLL